LSDLLSMLVCFALDHGCDVAGIERQGLSVCPSGGDNVYYG
jgi:hypothetical protein